MTAEPANEAELLAAGWRFAALSSGAELVRMLELYRETGIAVKTVPVDAASVEGCNGCYSEGETLYKVYTRPAD